MLRFETVVVSDLHLGARNSRTGDFLRFLDKLEVDLLVVAGDLFESPLLQGLKPRHVRVLEVLRQFARSCKLVWGCWTEQPSGFVGIRGHSARQFAWQSPKIVDVNEVGANVMRSNVTGRAMLAGSAGENSL
jgi:hypothetical protein